MYAVITSLIQMQPLDLTYNSFEETDNSFEETDHSFEETDNSFEETLLEIIDKHNPCKSNYVGDKIIFMDLFLLEYTRP